MTQSRLHLHHAQDLKPGPLLLINIGLTCLTLGVVFWQHHKMHNQAVLVQLTTGETLQATPQTPLYRTDDSIQAFVRSTLTAFYTWPGYLPDAAGVPVPDEGQLIQTDAGELRLPSRAYVASYALAEDFQHPFRETLAGMIPSTVYGGGVEAILLIEQISAPTKVAAGRWQVDVVATLKILDTSSNRAEVLPYNRRLTVTAIDPAVPDATATPHQQAILGVRQSGLQIEAIVPLTLEDVTDELQP
ncbi:MAG: hypothetical protein AAF959_01650 [Cyanobacteria bacterium P01_D01_bin.56]